MARRFRGKKTSQNTQNEYLQCTQSSNSVSDLFGRGLNRLAMTGQTGSGPYLLLIMAVKIRLKRVGTKNTPVFRIVVADGRSPRDGKFIEEIGTYQPLQKGDNFTVNTERAEYWISKGAQPSDTVSSFLRKARRKAAATPAA